MEVEDHPIEYNTFEGTIPPGEYGGGTVMLWDRGTYTPDEIGKGENAAGSVRRGLKAGKLSFTLAGERLRGSFALVRTDRGEKPKWLLIKHRDDEARRTGDITEEMLTSVATGRTLDEIAADNDRVWKSNRTDDASRSTRAGASGSGSQGSAGGNGSRSERGSAGRSPPGNAGAGEESGQTTSSAPGSMIAPMRPEPARAAPDDGEWTYEVWRGGDRVLAYVTHETAVLMDEHATDVTTRHRAIADELVSLAGRAGRPFVLDGEIADDADGSFFHASDLLLDGDRVLMDLAWCDRRAALESLFLRRRVKRIGLQKIGSDATAMMRRAARGGWPGMFARRMNASYEPGARSPALLRIAVH
jgi:bifunctional non-homologous end joining protein LigD